MSQVAALLLMYLTEEDAFWALHTLMCDEIHAMHGFFIPGFPKLIRFQQHHDKILHKMLPKLKKHMDKQDVYSSLYTTKWFFQCFLDRVPFTLALRLWDNFILDGDIVLTSGAYCILKMHTKTLLRCNFEQTMELLQSRLELDFGFEPDEVVRQLRACVVELRRVGLSRPPPSSTVGAATDAERPPSRFGEVLALPVDDLRRAASSVVSRRKYGRSRTPSISQSTPVTPVGDSPLPPTCAPNGHTVIPVRSPAITTIYVRPVRKNIANGPVVGPLDFPISQPGFIRSPSDRSTPIAEFTSVGGTPVEAPRPGRQAAVKHVLSVYDNVEMLPSGWAAVEDDDEESLVLGGTFQCSPKSHLFNLRASNFEPDRALSVDNVRPAVAHLEQHHMSLSSPNPAPVCLAKPAVRYDGDDVIVAMVYADSPSRAGHFGDWSDADASKMPEIRSGPDHVTNVEIDPGRLNATSGGRAWKEENFFYTESTRHWTRYAAPSCNTFGSSKNQYALINRDFLKKPGKFPLSHNNQASGST